jgi:4a-hydroxytetrahydrobiopterin dehydratase
MLVYAPVRPAVSIDRELRSVIDRLLAQPQSSVRMRPRRLAKEALDAACSTIPGWTLRENLLHRELRFASFAQAFDFMTTMAAVSESMNHHPEWRNVYRDLVIDLMTHDAGGISDLDIAWARRADAELRALGLA